MFFANLSITDLLHSEIQSAYDYVYSHYELSTQNEYDREAVSTLLRLAEAVLKKAEDVG